MAATPSSISSPAVINGSSSDHVHVIIGGGIAGVTCAQELCRLFQMKIDDDETKAKTKGILKKDDAVIPHVILISQSALVKVATNITKLTKNIEHFGKVS
jgi:thioredoxin reductase